MELDQSGIKVAEQAANEAVARVTNSTAKKVANVTVNRTTQDCGKAALTRSVLTALYAVGSNNILVDLADDLRSKEKKDSDSSNTLKLILQSIQMVMAMVAQMLGSGIFTQVVMAGPMTSFLKVANLLQIGPMGAEVVAGVGNYEALSGQARAIKAIAKTQAELTILNILEDELTKEQKQQMGRALTEQKQSAETTQALAGHLYDSYEGANRALLAAV